MKFSNLINVLIDNMGNEVTVTYRKGFKIKMIPDDISYAEDNESGFNEVEGYITEIIENPQKYPMSKGTLTAIVENDDIAKIENHKGKIIYPVTAVEG